ncbi:MAG: class IV adenylate cyclase [Caloramator sp.]|nr:class IV adenylate cyclase [Caloramator sp.]
MKEIEVKIIDIDVNKIKEQLIKLGAKKITEEFQENYFFDLPIKDDGYIRIRKTKNLLDNTEKIILTSKLIISKNFSRQTIENDVLIDSVEAGINFLKSIGINLSKKATKHRESFLFNNCIIDFDSWNKEEFPFPYIEIESEDESYILETVKLLKIDSSNVTSKTLNEIKKEKGLI